jgi:hypothetical protein
MKWNDGNFCNVADPFTDYLVMADSDDVDNRQKCFDFCSKHRIEEKGTCCGLIFENSVESGDTKILCGLYFSDIVQQPVT